MSQAELALEELNKEINQIVKSYAQNDTSYFPNVQKVVEAFESYLKCLESDSFPKRQLIAPQFDCFLFKERIQVKVLAKSQRFFHQILTWNFGFNAQLRSLMTSKSNQIKLTSEPMLGQVSVVEIIFLMYLCLEVESKEIIGKGVTVDENQMFMLREITHILEDFYQAEDLEKSFGEQKAFIPFKINEEKLLYLINFKTLILKVQKKKINFTSTLKKMESAVEKKPDFDYPIKTEDKNIEKNFSLVSVQSDFESSMVLDKKVEKLRKDLAVLPVKVEAERTGFEMKNFTNEEIFRNVSLE